MTLDVHAALPHRAPMHLIDRVVELTPGRRLTAVREISTDEPWYTWAGGADNRQRPAYPRMLLIESWGQAAALLASTLSTTVPGPVLPLFGSLGGLCFHRDVFPGDLLTHRVRLARVLRDNLVFEGDTVCGDDPVITVGRVILALRSADTVRPAAG